MHLLKRLYTVHNIYMCERRNSKPGKISYGQSRYDQVYKLGLGNLTQNKNFARKIASFSFVMKFNFFLSSLNHISQEFTGIPASFEFSK